jgi:pentatricopeptide repeat protein
MYAKCGLILKAREVFDELLVQDVVSWNALIGGYADHGRGEDALDLFHEMQNKGIARDAVTFVCALKACGVAGASNKGREIHDEIARNGLLKRDFLLANALIDMYAKCGEFRKAQEAFDEHPNRDSAAWNGLIVGYVKHGLYKEALDCFDEMKRYGVSPDAATFVASLKACGSAGFLEKGCEIHQHIVNERLLGEEPIIGNVLVDMYSSRCDSLQQAQAVFDALVFRDVVTWTALITGYARHGHAERAFDLYRTMRRDGMLPNEVTLVCMLAICGSIGAPYKGQEVHNELARRGYERDPIVANSLIDMYASCGLLDDAKHVFGKLSVRSVVSWSALISGSALLSDVDEAFLLFDKMIEEGQNPNSITFVSILNACSHEGLVDEGQMCFSTVSDECGIDSTLEHYSCLIDLLGRSGQLDTAVLVVERMPFHPNIILWHTVMGACRKWADADRGKQAFHHVVEYNEEDAPAYISLSNMYAEGAMEED